MGIGSEVALPQLTIWEDNFPIIAVLPLAQILPTLSPNRRSTIRRTLYRAKGMAWNPSWPPPAKHNRRAGGSVALHREMWQGRPIGPEHTTARFLEHLAAASERLTAAGLGGISEFRREGRVIISSLLLFGREYVGTCLHGASREALEQYQVSSLYIWDALNRATERSLAYVSLLRGAEPYKRSFGGPRSCRTDS